MKAPGPGPITGRELAVRAERVDADNWLDNFAAAPAPVGAALGLYAVRREALAMVRSRVPFSHFNMVLTLGCPARVDDQAFEAIDRFYAEGSIGQHWVLVNDFSEPGDLGRRLLDRGYEPAGAWDRVVLQGPEPDRWVPFAQGCERVTAANASAWCQFVQDCYRMPPLIGAWLQALVGRPGWLHVIRRAHGRGDGPIVMARSLYQDDSGWAWLGIDAPVPGVMASCHEDDQRVVATLLAAAAEHGARAFVSDIEVPDRDRRSEAYLRWEALGFTAAYLRRLYTKRRQG